MTDLHTIVVVIGAFCAALISIGVVFGVVMRFFTRPLEERDRALVQECKTLKETVVHNRANTDQKIEALATKQAKTDDDVRELQRENATVSKSIESLKELFMQRFDDLEKRMK